MKTITEKTDDKISIDEAIELHEKGCIIAIARDGAIFFLSRETTTLSVEHVYFKRLFGEAIIMKKSSTDYRDIKLLRKKCLTEAMMSGYELLLFETEQELFLWCAEQVK